MTVSSDAKTNAQNWIRNLIAKDLAEKCARNPMYSMRRYAASLGVSHALLSLVLNGKRAVSHQLATQVINRIGGHTEEFFHHFPTPTDKPSSTEPVEDGFDKISLEEYEQLSNWYYYAILSLLDIKGVQWESTWIADHLGISEELARTAMQFLVERGFVKKLRNGHWKQSTRPLKVENVVSTDITRRAHSQLLAKANESLERDPIEVRDFSYCTFAMNEELIPLALKEIRFFRRQLMKKLESKGRPSRVYNLTVQIFPTSRGAV